MDVCSFRSIKSILKTGKDREALPADEPVVKVCRSHHHNVRGADYYARQETTEQPVFAEKGGV